MPLVKVKEDETFEFALRRFKDRGHMGFVIGAGVDHRDAPAAHDIGAGPGEGEWPRIGRDEPAHQGRGLDDFARLAQEAFDALPGPFKDAAGEVVIRIDDFADGPDARPDTNRSDEAGLVDAVEH